MVCGWMALSGLLVLVVFVWRVSQLRGPPRSAGWSLKAPRVMSPAATSAAATLAAPMVAVTTISYSLPLKRQLLPCQADCCHVWQPNKS